MAFLFSKFQEVVINLAKSSTFAKNPRQIQFEADMNRLFLFTSYNRLGRDAEEADVEEIIEMASKATVNDQQKQVQENIHMQIMDFCTSLDKILLPDARKKHELGEAAAQSNGAPRRSGLSFAVGQTAPTTTAHLCKCLLSHSISRSTVLPETRPLSREEVSQNLKDLAGFKLDIKPSKIPHKEAGQGLFVDGEADVGTVIALYPGVIYTPAYYRYIPGYPRVDSQNPYLITRYDGTVINAQPWGTGGENREIWDGLTVPASRPNLQIPERGSDRVWKMLSKPLEGAQVRRNGDALERRNPLALAHFANHPAKDMVPNVMICPYDFPLTEKDMRTYIPNVSFGNAEEVNMKRFGSFWFKSWGQKGGSDVSVLRTLVLIATRPLNDEEVLLNYRLSNTKRRPSWYIPVDEEEDRRRWG